MINISYKCKYVLYDIGYMYVQCTYQSKNIGLVLWLMALIKWLNHLILKGPCTRFEVTKGCKRKNVAFF